MQEFQQKKIIHTIMYSKMAMIILALACLLLLRSIVELNQKRGKVVKDRDKAHLEKNVLVDKVAKAEAKLSFIETDRGKENYIRTAYPVVKEGEGVIIIYNSSTSPVTDVKKDEGNWGRFTNWIKSLFWREENKEEQ